MRHLIIIAAIALFLSAATTVPGSSAAMHGPTPTPSDHIILGTPTAVPVPAPALSVIWLHSDLARASWAGFGCLTRYGVRGDRLFVGCADDTLDTPAEMGDTFRLVVNTNNEAAVSARVGIYGVALLPIVSGGVSHTP